MKRTKFAIFRTNPLLGIIILLFLAAACSSDPSLFDYFPNKVTISDDYSLITNSYSNVERMYCNDSLLVTYNSGQDCCYTVYNLKTGDVRNQLGIIGHGHKEIPIGCFGCIYKGDLVVFSIISKIVAKFSLSSSKKETTADTIISYSLGESMLSSVIPVDTDRYLGMGIYQWNKHYVLFDSEGNVYDSAVPVYNYKDKRFNKFGIFLSNQGELVKHPSMNIFVGCIYNSSVIDFMCVRNNRIHTIKKYETILPSWEPVKSRNMTTVEWTDKTINGILSLTANENNVYALYSEESMKDISYKSKNILVFDWNGNPLHRIEMGDYIQKIAVNNTKLFTLSEDENGIQHINAYILSKLN